MTSTPGTGHLHPIAPLVRELAARHHDILWATAAESCPRVERFGFRAVPAGMGVRDRTEAFLARAPHLLTLPPREQRSVALPVMFGEIAAPRMREDLGAVFEEHSPDLVLHDLAEMSAAPIATARGIPHVTIGFSGALSDALLAGVLHGVESVWASEGVTPTASGFQGDLLLHPFPTSMDTPRGDGRSAPMRPVPIDDSGDTAPPGLVGFGTDRPGIYVTFGTEIATRAPWVEIFEALADLDVDVVATVGPRLDPTTLGPTPPNVAVERYVPQQRILGRAGAVISHAGAGTLLGAASAGVPQLLLPIGADQWENADLLSAIGAGLTLEREQRDAETIQRSLTHLLDDRDVAGAARELQRDVVAMAHPGEVVAEVEALV